MRRIVIIGGGFAGSAVAISLLRRGHDAIALVERSGTYGRGIAYATPDRQHLLNVPVGSMSALADEPEHLLDWTRRRGLGVGALDYLPRDVYGDYVSELLDETDGRRIERVADEAVAVDDDAVVTAGGRRLPAAAVVVAVGISPPVDLGRLAALAGHPAYVHDPWAHDHVRALARTGEVLVVGTGLTMIDVALTLSADDDGPRILAASTHGELPRTHRPDAPELPPPAARPGEFTTADALVGHVEERACAAEDWRLVIDSLRPVTQELWRGLPAAEKEAFVARHFRRWEVHRSRIAPQIRARVDELQAAGRLEIRAATIADARPEGGRLAVRLGTEPRLFDAVVNATGPAWDCRLADSALLRNLLAAGQAAPGPAGLGLATAPDGALVDAAGRVSDRLFTLGALRRGELWETIAVPELRTQAAALAERLAA